MFRQRRSEWDTENGNEIPQQYVELETLGHACAGAVRVSRLLRLAHGPKRATAIEGLHMGPRRLHYFNALPEPPIRNRYQPSSLKGGQK
jgi:hypothetical protein